MKIRLGNDDAWSCDGENELSGFVTNTLNMLSLSIQVWDKEQFTIGVRWSTARISETPEGASVILCETIDTLWNLSQRFYEELKRVLLWGQIIGIS